MSHSSLNNAARPGISVWRILAKGVLLFVLLSSLLLLPAVDGVTRISAYNHLVPGLLRFPVILVPTAGGQSFDDIGISSLNVLFAAHTIASGPKPAGEFRVVLLGDSSPWGVHLAAGQIISEQLNALNLHACDGRRVHVFDLAYPDVSILKDLLFLRGAMRYQPDLILWFVTLDSFWPGLQLGSPPTELDANGVADLIGRYQLRVSSAPASMASRAGYFRLFGERGRELAEWFRLQAYAVTIAATGVDYAPLMSPYSPVQLEVLPRSVGFHSIEPPDLPLRPRDLNGLRAGLSESGGVPILFVNEPIYISQAANSDVRYNKQYSRWMYDRYREMLSAAIPGLGGHYLDLWASVPAEDFTNHPLHPNLEGTKLIADRLAPKLASMACAGGS